MKAISAIARRDLARHRVKALCRSFMAYFYRQPEAERVDA
ncbi:hypothetical protein BN135_2003 [Cronobacter muytjensii 530]